MKKITHNKKSIQFFCLLILSSIFLLSHTAHSLHTDEERAILNKKKQEDETANNDPAARRKDALLRSLARKQSNDLDGSAVMRLASMASRYEKQPCTGDMIDEKEEPDNTNPVGLVGYLPERYRTFVKKVRGEIDITDVQKRFLAYGPTKVGKTASIRAIVQEDPTNTTLVECEASQLLGETDAQTFKNIDKLFASARKAGGKEKKVIIFVPNLHHLNSVAHRDEVRKAPLEYLEIRLNEMEKKDKNIFFVGEVRDISQLPSNFLHQFDASAITYYPLPDAQSRCEMLAYQFLKYHFGGAYISRANLRTYLNGTEGMSHGDLESVRRDSVLQAQRYNNGDISPEIVLQVIKLTKEKNKEVVKNKKETSALSDFVFHFTREVIIPNLSISNIAMALWYWQSFRNAVNECGRPVMTTQATDTSGL